jgi:microcystin-dependent protein
LTEVLFDSTIAASTNPFLENFMNYMVSQIVLFPLTFTPRGFASCEGQLLPIAQYTLLFSLIGNTFGGDGETTFALPDYRGLAPKGSTYFIVIEGGMPTQ